MPHLLHIDSSAVSQGSVSRALGQSFRRVWQQENPDGVVTYRDLGAAPVPPLTEAGVTAGFMPAVAHDERQRHAMLLRDELVAELLSADALLISTPMYNWSIPSTLKAWIDQVLVNDRTITFDGTPGPLTGRPATVVASYGGGYTPGAPMEQHNHVGPYLETVFGTGLGMDVQVIAAQLSLAPRTPAMAGLIPLAEQSLADAQAAVLERARQTALVPLR
ncbi:FMN-dependent NADH-azoreductase [Streptacidiphilus sp. MAP12-33]|uniref:FMN-dependent NADH-azoreductase n=1 Tax=Streptacidiphilus sp. MAP12-33 TaxID=3156266 RepID=UPI003517B618